MQANKKKLWILLGALVVIVVIIVIATAKNKKTVTNNTPAANNNATTASSTNDASLPVNPGNNSTTTATTTVVSSQALKEAVVVVPGANAVTKQNQVITPEGKVAVNNTVPNTPNAPRQTEPIASVSTLPAEVVKVSVSAGGISPKSFNVKPGAPTTIAFSSVDDNPHTIMFDDSSLSSVAAGLGPHVTRAITFNAPTTPGNYTFRCGFPGHAERGEVGTMIVK